MHLHCCYGICKSDSRRPEAGVTFMPFPKPNKRPAMAKRWAYLCGNQLTIKKITKYSYICSKHFPVGSVLDIKANPSLEPFDARKHVRKTESVRRRCGCPRLILQTVLIFNQQNFTIKWTFQHKLQSLHALSLYITNWTEALKYFNPRGFNPLADRRHLG